MKPVIKSVSVWGHPNIRTWEPEDPNKIAEVVFIDMGPRSGKTGSVKAANTFYIRVATPNGLTTLEAKDGILATRPLLIMQRYDFNNLWNWLEKTVATCEADTWPACVDKLRLYFDWEFSNYQER